MHLKKIIKIFYLFTFLSLSTITSAQELGYSNAAPGGYGFKIFNVESATYPFVQVYFRTFTQNQKPLINLNELNIGLMVKGRAYDPFKRQYSISSLQQRNEATRTVIVIDSSLSMAGIPFKNAVKATAKFIDGKRHQDEIAILATKDTVSGYEIVSNFERDSQTLGNRLADLTVDGKKTRLYDTIGAAIQLCGMSAQGSVTPAADNYIVSCSIVVLSDGKDDNSALSRAELNNRISQLKIPIPIYSLAYTKDNSSKYFRNLESLSKNSFGIYYLCEAYSKMQSTVEEIQYILQNDYVLTFRAYQPIDGEKHSFKIGLDYPARSGKYVYESGYFEAIEAPPYKAIDDAIRSLSEFIPMLPDKDPYLKRTVN